MLWLFIIPPVLLPVEGSYGDCSYGDCSYGITWLVTVREKGGENCQGGEEGGGG